MTLQNLVKGYLDIAVVDQLSDHGHTRAEDHPPPLQHDGVAQGTPGGRGDRRLGQGAKRVVEGHGLDVQGCEDCLLVREVGVVAGGRNLSISY